MSRDPSPRTKPDAGSAPDLDVSNTHRSPQPMGRFHSENGSGWLPPESVGCGFFPTLVRDLEHIPV